MTEKNYYSDRPDGMIMAVTVDGSRPEFHVVSERPLFQAFQRIINQTLGVTPDGEHFVVNALGGDEGEPLAVVTNWTAAIPGE